MPPLMMATLSQSFSATSSTWVEKKIAPPCVAHLAHHALEQMRRLGVQAHKGLIHDDQLRLMNPRGDDGQLLLHAVGIGRDGLRQIARQFKDARRTAAMRACRVRWR